MRDKISKNFFISYRTLDERWATWIAWQLEGEGYSTFLQAWDFRPGHNFVRQMEHGLTSCERMIAVLTPSYCETEGYAAAEWHATFRRDPGGEQAVLIPVRVEACDVEGLLGSIAWIDLVGLDEATARERLLAGLKPSRAKPRMPPGFPPKSSVLAESKPGFPAENPYRGLEAFRAEHRAFFKGRERYVIAVLEKLKDTRLVAVVGASGSGKSSLALAGVLPVLQNEGWLAVDLRPRRDPFRQLALER